MQTLHLNFKCPSGCLAHKWDHEVSLQFNAFLACPVEPIWCGSAYSNIAEKENIDVEKMLFTSNWKQAVHTERIFVVILSAMINLWV